VKKEVFLIKLGQALLTIFIILVLNYFLFRIMPGDPVSILARNPKMTAEGLARLNEMFGLNQPWYVQFGIYIRDLATGNLGTSFIYKRPVLDMIAERIVPTLLLAALAEILAIAAGMFIGIVAAWRRGSKLDVGLLGVALVTYSIPTFWLGIMLIAVFSGWLRLFPVSGMVSASLVFADSFSKIGDIAHHLILPTLTLAVVLVGEYALIMRSTMIEVLTEDYIVTAEAKGLSPRQVLHRHALPNAMIPMTTIIALSLGFTITGALQVETVFSWPGLGRLMYDALQGRDYPLLQGIFLVTSVCVVGANFITDILYRVIDPRVKG
jgi:peptide/nickel transport system permease protein